MSIGFRQMVIGLVIMVLTAGFPSALSQPENPGRTPSIVYFLGSTDHNSQWVDSVATTAKAAALDFGIDLELVKTAVDRQEVLSTIKSRINNGPPPDYVLLVNYRGELLDALKFLEQEKISSFVYNAGLAPLERKAAGLPGENFQYWLGELLPDDEQAGYDLAAALIDRARYYKHEDRKIRLLAVTGSYSNPVAMDRVKGMKRAIADNEDTELLQVISAQWQGEVIKQKYPFIIQRYGIIDAVWAANDDMALGVSDMPTSIAPFTNAAAHLVVGGMD